MKGVGVSVRYLKEFMLNFKVEVVLCGEGMILNLIVYL